MAKRSIHLTDLSEQFIAQRHQIPDDTPNISGYCNAAFEQLAFLARESLPSDVTEADMVELYNIFAGCDDVRLSLPHNLAAALLTYYGATVPEQLPNEQLRALLSKLANYSQAQQFALLDKVRLYWAQVANDGVTPSSREKPTKADVMRSMAQLLKVIYGDRSKVPNNVISTMINNPLTAIGLLSQRRELPVSGDKSVKLAEILDQFDAEDLQFDSPAGLEAQAVFETTFYKD